MSKLLNELRSILTHHHLHVTSQTNQGTAHLIEAHLKQLEAASGDAERVTAEAHRVLNELYGALNAPAPVESAPPTQSVIVGEPGPELALPVPAAPKAAEEPPAETPGA